ncbi:phosphoglycerate mutase [Catellatospora sp. IY07-71]|uniref:histidine phosphatase family protein n=1 Tax=Catellatospora sp. IY07-71 TaxID=2728827 RepID=UPI001BB424E3|nr:histidine phosphatase family protein [Catellatospora sp. IY07-71]BCJ74387.1 phosphoglycerate mutase [Catellatospora sp. IY07-71]
MTTLHAELVLVRHGEAVCNVTGVAGGERGCTGLTELGRWQAAQVAARLAREHADRPFDVLYTSPRRRAAETAAAIADRLGLPVLAEPGLRNPDHGSADGLPWAQARAGLTGSARHHPDRVPAPGAETWNGYLTRSATALRTIIERHPGRRILVAGHRETVETAQLAMVCHPGCAGRGPVGVVADHTGVTRWRHETDRHGYGTWLLAVHNDIGHLAPD